MSLAQHDQFDIILMASGKCEPDKQRQPPLNTFESALPVLEGGALEAIGAIQRPGAPSICARVAGIALSPQQATGLNPRRRPALR